ncbi:ECF transporter S component [Clostridium gasigenes]|uniref:Niacin transporter n=1 Tax=Clostridium gasigenes TaxID=94869 RepID=A0A1H0M2M2_9CLOT|nr:ECF transporter S component [Clostridium gasigenes]MBB6622289.1 ECF transporter S component [Clostridium gasigenes]MBU3087069.1 ECF transporter S component [Clostridium gasigenes]MBU3105924.1 ECF transporter S component [Clostridium gasigenes]MBU3131113.1 ECF transporter S component [Clostridium gasigenes]SDO74420.1 niacin transporter [Clostridium gasigenes]
MNSNKKVRQMVFAALLTAFAIIIPIQFGFLKIIIPPFTATIASHVPMFIAMLISPMVAVVVGIGSTLGFSLTGLPLPVVFRASTHIVVGLIGAIIVLKNRNFKMAIIITGPIHGILEALVIIPFVPVGDYKILIITCIGAIAHHYVDGTIAYALAKAIAKSRRKNIYTAFNDSKSA